MKWEYDSIQEYGVQLLQKLRDRGLQGWEVCGMTEKNGGTFGSTGKYTVLLKRPVQEKE